jgi:putative endonuclease
MQSHDLGRRSEEIACRYLSRNGYTILDRNYRAGHKEIDIVARSGHTIAFVEVKARAGGSYGHPLEAITYQKRREVAHAARVWIGSHATPGCEYRFDAVAITWSGQSHIVEHFQDAWRVR